MDRLRIHLMGSFELWSGERPVRRDAWRGHKALQVLKILITDRRRIVSTDELIEWLWPELTPVSARNSLWVAVSRLRSWLELHAPGKGGERAAPCARRLSGARMRFKVGRFG
jgi:DNA-binding SARP family transcriptional activator